MENRFMLFGYSESGGGWNDHIKSFNKLDDAISFFNKIDCKLDFYEIIDFEKQTCVWHQYTKKNISDGNIYKSY
jgi:hypothetical protein